MKKSAFVLFLGILSVITGCVKQDFDQPPVIIPTVNFTSNITIARLLALYDSLKPAGAAIDTLQITMDTIIEGIIVGNDESGNIYKNLYIQDGTGGICLSIDQSSLYAEFKLGQRIFVKCKGLYMGTYGGLTEIGYGVYNNQSIGRMPSTLIPMHIFKDSLPGNVPAPDTIDFSGTLDDKLSKLVIVPDVTFPDQGQPFVTGNVTTNRDIADAMGTVIKIGGENFIIRTSNYANFANSLLPEGKGAIRGILSIYNGQYQMYLRDLNDLVNFDTAGIGPLPFVVYENNFDADPPDWVKFSIQSNKNWAWSSSFTCMAVNGYGGDVASDDWLISPGIELTGVSNTILTFRTWTKYTDAGITNPLEVFVSTDYSGSGDPSSATWVPLTCTLPAQNSAAWTASGDVDLSMYHQKVYIGYRYKSSGTGSNSSSSWEMDTFKVEGEK